MLDLVGIVFSTAMILIVIYRAVQLNASVPWFQNLNETNRADPPTTAPPRGGPLPRIAPVRPWRERR